MGCGASSQVVPSSSTVRHDLINSASPVHGFLHLAEEESDPDVSKDHIRHAKEELERHVNYIRVVFKKNNDLDTKKKLIKLHVVKLTSLKNI
jgi:hypothetical protein